MRNRILTALLVTMTMAAQKRTVTDAEVKRVHDSALLIDTHDGHVCDEVWDLYADAIARFGARSTMIEWDARVPAFEVLQDELARAERHARVDAPSEGRRAA